MDVKINGKNYADLIVGIERAATINYSDANSKMLDYSNIIDPLNTTISYKITIDSAYKDQKLLEDFWNAVIQPRKEGFLFEAPYNQTTISFRGYVVGDITQGLISAINNFNLWDNIELTIKPLEAQVKEVVY